MKPAQLSINADRETMPPGYISNSDYFLSLLAERNVRFDAEILAVSTALATARETTTRDLDLLKATMEREIAQLERHGDLRSQAERAACENATIADEKAVAVALTAVETAAAKAEVANEKRFDSVNEFRAQLRDQASTFIPRAEAEQRLGQLAARIEELRTSDAMRTGRSAGSSALYGWLVGAVGLLATIVIIANSIFS